MLAALGPIFHLIFHIAGVAVGPADVCVGIVALAGGYVAGRSKGLVAAGRRCFNIGIGIVVTIANINVRGVVVFFWVINIPSAE